MTLYLIFVPIYDFLIKGGTGGVLGTPKVQNLFFQKVFMISLLKPNQKKKKNEDDDMKFSVLWCPYDHIPSIQYCKYVKIIYVELSDKKILFYMRTSDTNQKNVNLDQKVTFFFETDHFEVEIGYRARTKSQNFFV